ncbi:predicted protein [Sclerotinia sclerotiorum 1980 UF-70]|uniref:Uncharacterized protein n=1 Tax=Sclerotinia sclerotiorum (strain ATCC 18683 / 1980 / Ss-1) TaxID=665079 RepID=A7E785_SCLS1|nr:predicted protein [Sclerotinia sclerotiorum 1980 UF-70]EDN96237.1 predicted protein [Sclerotinia sclerotiorum 1980 UF-70]
MALVEAKYKQAQDTFIFNEPCMVSINRQVARNVANWLWLHKIAVLGLLECGFWSSLSTSLPFSDRYHISLEAFDVHFACSEHLEIASELFEHAYFGLDELDYG